MRRLHDYILALVVLFLAACGPGVLVVTVTGLPPQMAKLLVLVQENGKEPMEHLSFDLTGFPGGVDYSFGLRFPQGAMGTLLLGAAAVDAKGCILMSGKGEGPADSGAVGMVLKAVHRPDLSCTASGPAVFQVTPERVASTAGDMLTLTGYGFHPGAAVSIAGQELAVKKSTPTELQVQAPSATGLHGKVDVTVRNPDGTRSSRKDVLAYYYGRVSFQSSTVAMIESHPNYLIMADLNGDHRPDLLTTNDPLKKDAMDPNINGSLSVFFNMGASYDRPVVYEYQDPKAMKPVPIAGPNPTAVAVADLDGDGRLDAAVTDLRTGADTDAGTLRVVKKVDQQMPDMTKVEVALYDPGRYPDAVLTGDIDQDGNADVVVFNNTLTAVSLQLMEGKIGPMDLTKFIGQVSVLRNLGKDGMGKWIGLSSVMQRRDVGLLVNNGVLADVNGDGYPDVVANCLNLSGTPSVAVFLNQHGKLPDAPAYYPIDGSSGTVSTADVDGDGKPDIVASNRKKMQVNSVSVLLNKGGGVFASAPMNYPVADNAFFIATGDLDGDGLPDLVITNDNGDSNGTLSVLLNRGDGTFPGQYMSLPSAVGSAVVAAGDIDGDGRVDLAVSNRGDQPNKLPGSITIYLNTSE